MLVARPKNNSALAEGVFSPYKPLPNDGPTSTESTGSTSLDTCALLSRFEEQKTLKRTAERLKNRSATKEKLFSLYRSSGLVDESDKLSRCCSKFGVLTCGNHIIRSYPTDRCHLPLCPDCATYRQRRAYKRLFPKFAQFASVNQKDRAVLVTLTIKDSKENLLDIHSFIKKSFRKLRQMKRWQSHIRGGIASFELTISENKEWHYHIHILALRKSFARYEQADLTEDWRRATSGKGFIVDIRAVRELQSGFREVLKYQFKPLDVEKNRFDADKLKQFVDLCRRKRLAESFGSFFGFDFEDEESEFESEILEAGSPCPKCFQPLEFLLMKRADLERFYLSIVNRSSGGLPMRC
jgi:hypothetical protein